MDQRLVRWVWLGVFLVLADASATAGDTSQIYRPRHRLAEDMIAIAEVVLGEAGKVALDPGHNTLVLIGPEEEIAATVAILEAQDRAPEIVRIRYRSLDLRQLANAGLEIAWEADVGFGIGRVIDAAARVDGRLHRTRETEDFEAELRVESGQSGWVGSGRAVPLIGRDRDGADVAGIAEAQRGFRARPRVLDDGRIRLEIATSDARVDDLGRVDFAGATTTVIARAGETIAIGDLAQASRSQRTNGRSWSTRKSREKRVFLLSLEIEAR